MTIHGGRHRASASHRRCRAPGTPVLPSAMLSERFGAPVVLKAESLQRAGSFKLRGALGELAALGDPQPHCPAAAPATTRRRSRSRRGRAAAGVGAGQRRSALGARVVAAGDDSRVLAARARADEAITSSVHPFRRRRCDRRTGNAEHELLDDVPDLRKAIQGEAGSPPGSRSRSSHRVPAIEVVVRVDPTADDRRRDHRDQRSAARGVVRRRRCTSLRTTSPRRSSSCSSIRSSSTRIGVAALVGGLVDLPRTQNDGDRPCSTAQREHQSARRGHAAPRDGRRPPPPVIATRLSGSSRRAGALLAVVAPLRGAPDRGLVCARAAAPCARAACSSCSRRAAATMPPPFCVRWRRGYRESQPFDRHRMTTEQGPGHQSGTHRNAHERETEALDERTGGSAELLHHAEQGAWRRARSRRRTVRDPWPLCLERGKGPKVP